MKMQFIRTAIQPVYQGLEISAEIGRIIETAILVAKYQIMLIVIARCFTLLLLLFSPLNEKMLYLI